MNAKHAAVLAVFLILASSLCIPLAARGADGDVATGTAQNPLSSLTANAGDCTDKTFYVAVGGQVSITPSGSGGQRMSVDGVTSGFGLSVSDGALSGTVTKAGTITVDILLGTIGTGPTFTIVAVNTSAAEHTVTLNANDGTVSPSSVTTQNGVVTSLPTPVRSGYDFDGWYTAQIGGSLVTASSSNPYSPAADMTLWAHWTASPGTEIETGSASSPLSGLSATCHQANGKTFYVAVGGQVSITPSGSGAQRLVVGEGEGGNGLSESNGTLSGTITSAGTITVELDIGTNAGSLGGSFTIVAIDTSAAGLNHVVTFARSTAGGSVAPTQITVADGASISVSGNHITIGGQTVTATPDSECLFDRWSTSSGTTPSGTVTADMRIFAHFAINRGHSDSPLNSLVLSQETESLVNGTFYVKVGGQVSIPGVTESDYTSSWNSVTSGYGLSISNHGVYGTISKAGSIEIDGSWTLDNESGVSHATIIAVAENTPVNTVTVRYNANGGYDAPSDSAVGTTGTEALVTISSTKPIRGAYHFLGWSASSSASTPTYYAGQQYSFEVGTTVLYAVWESDGSGITLTQQAGTTKTYTWAEAFGQSYYNTMTNAADGYGAIVSRFNSGWTALSGSSVTVDQNGLTVTLPAEVPTASNYLRVMWAYESGEENYRYTNLTVEGSGATHTVTFVAGTGGTVNKATATVQHGATVTLSGNTLTVGGTTVTATPNSGYSFQGWSAANGSTVNGDMTVTAYFTSSSQGKVIRFWDATGNTLYGTQPAATTGYTTITFDNPSVGSGKTFIGWYTSPNSLDYLYVKGSNTIVVPSDGLDLYAVVTTQPCTVTFSVSPAGAGTVNDTASDSAVVAKGASILGDSTSKMLNVGGKIVVAAEASGYTFQGWSTTSGTVNGNMTFTATFAPVQTDVTVTIAISPSEVGTVKLGAYTANSITVAPRSEITLSGNNLTIDGKTLKAVPANGWQFSKWTLRGLGDVTNGMVIGTSNTTLTAVFTQTPAYTVTLNANGGSVSPSSMTYTGSALTLPEPTYTGYAFQGWYTAVTGGTLVTSPYTPSASTTLWARWTAVTPDDITLTFAVNPAGTGSVKQSGSVVTSITVAAGSAVSLSGTSLTIDGKTVTAVPASNYQFSKWTMRFGDLTSGASLSTSQTITAVFEPIPGHTVTLAAGGTGSGAIKAYNNGTVGSNASTLAVAHGSTVTISGDVLTVDGKSVKAIASSGSTFDGWSVANGSAVNADMTITANFKAGATVGAPSRIAAVIGNQTSFNAVTSPDNASVSVNAPAGWNATYGSGKVTFTIPASASPGDYNLSLTVQATGYTTGQATVTVHAAAKLVFQNTPVADCVITEAS